MPILFYVLVLALFPTIYGSDNPETAPHQAITEESVNLDDLFGAEAGQGVEQPQNIPEMKDISLVRNYWTLLPSLLVFYLAVYTRRVWREKSKRNSS